ncbi:MAG TPA: SLBB domain-containing protein [Candidatus Sulfotelmatobacter sp.]|nr:SLBB domain-containing protein [Candidatus Sulfotelmatobacter sp.]
MISRFISRSFLPLVLVLSLAAPALADLGSADSTSMDWSRVPEYRIVPGDLLRFNFGPLLFNYQDLLREARVRPDGRISVYPVGEVLAAGRTVQELQTAVLNMMAAEYKNPRVSIELADVAGNKVHVMGQVKSPGSYPVQPFMTVSQAIAAAGGFADDAARNSILLVHRDGAHTVLVARIRMDRIIRQAAFGEDLQLSRFDLVIVPRSAIGNIDIFLRQFFGDAGVAFNTSILGWELFHLDRVFFIGNTSH